MAFPRALCAALAGLAVGADLAPGTSCLHDGEPTGDEEDSLACLQLGLEFRGSPSPSSLSVPAPTPDSFANLRDDAPGCGLMVLSTFFTTRVDWQREQHAKPQFVNMQQFYESAAANGVNVTILYDDLPEEILRYETESFKFQKISFAEYDPEEGLNDVRFNMVRDVVDQNPSWQNIFLSDLFDVKIGRNPCGEMRDGKLYVGRQMDSLYHNLWMMERFEQMGGKYMHYFLEAKPSDKILNAGIVGGRRDVFSRFLKEMADVELDPELTARKAHEQENVNMAAFNYVVRKSMGLQQDAEEGRPGWVSGAPVHSDYKLYQEYRKDVWFIHK